MIRSFRSFIKSHLMYLFKELKSWCHWSLTALLGTYSQHFSDTAECIPPWCSCLHSGVLLLSCGTAFLVLPLEYCFLPCSFLSTDTNIGLWTLRKTPTFSVPQFFSLLGGLWWYQGCYQCLISGCLYHWCCWVGVGSRPLRWPTRDRGSFSLGIIPAQNTESCVLKSAIFLLFVSVTF